MGFIVQKQMTLISERICISTELLKKQLLDETMACGDLHFYDYDKSGAEKRT